MKSLKIFCLLATIAIFCSSCQRWIPYSASVQEKYHLSQNDLKGIQFCLSQQIVLYKASADGIASEKEGQLVVHSDSQLDRIILKRGTPGVYVDGSSFQMAVSFEVGEGKYLVFGSETLEGPFKLQAKLWENNHGTLEYGGEEYIAEPGAGNAYLLIQMKRLRHIHHTSRIVQGRQVD